MKTKPGRATLLRSPDQKPEPEKQFIRVPCDCKGGGYMGHYDKVRCKCGHTWWALQPRRNGPLVAFLWPGDYRSGPIHNGRAKLPLSPDQAPS